MVAISPGNILERPEDNTQERLEDSIQVELEDNIQEPPVDNTREQLEDSIQERLEDSIQEQPEDNIQEQLEDNSLVERIQEPQVNFQEAPRLVEYRDILTLEPAQDNIQQERDNIQEQVNITQEEREVLVPESAELDNRADNCLLELVWDNKVEEEESVNIPEQE